MLPLCRALSDVLLTNSCPHCGHKFKKQGSWFATVDRYRCGVCSQQVRLSDEEKVKLFDAHAYLAEPPTTNGNVGVNR